jgi:hypothetical protein
MTITHILWSSQKFRGREKLEKLKRDQPKGGRRSHFLPMHVKNIFEKKNVFLLSFPHKKICKR